jgi:hypothetical protein
MIQGTKCKGTAGSSLQCVWRTMDAGPAVVDACTIDGH